MVEVHLTKVKHVTNAKGGKPGQVRLKGTPKLVTVDLLKESERLERLSDRLQGVATRKARLELESMADDDGGLGGWIIKGGPPLNGRLLEARNAAKLGGAVCASSCAVGEEWCLGLDSTGPYLEDSTVQDCNEAQPAFQGEQAWWDAWAERVDCWWVMTPHHAALQATQTRLHAHAHAQLPRVRTLTPSPIAPCPVGLFLSEQCLVVLVVAGMLWRAGHSSRRTLP